VHRSNTTRKWPPVARRPVVEVSTRCAGSVALPAPERNRPRNRRGQLAIQRGLRKETSRAAGTLAPEHHSFMTLAKKWPREGASHWVSLSSQCTGDHTRYEPHIHPQAAKQATRCHRPQARPPTGKPVDQGRPAPRAARPRCRVSRKGRGNHQGRPWPGSPSGCYATSNQAQR
jgi:hypothetical protein